MRAALLGAVLVCLPFGVSAADAPKKTAPPAVNVPPPPPMPKEDAGRNEGKAADAPQPETGLEPEITIITRGETRFEEYRVHGRRYMVKVTPKNGKPYYLIDREGNGTFSRSDFEPKIAVPTWVIKSW